MALTEMACGRTGAAIDYAESVESDKLLTSKDLILMRDQISRDWIAQSKQKAQKAHTNIPERSLEWDIFSERLESFKRYQLAFQFAPWRIMEDEAITSLFYATFRSQPPRTAEEMQQLILHNYKGIFNFDPSYTRKNLSNHMSKVSIPKDNPLQ
jgi:hypothetical protein